jgi:CheY-like chemotaxis protein
MYALGPNSIVVVEDNNDDVLILSRQLKKVKLEPHVKFIHDGKEAHKYLSQLALQEDPDILAIFLDLKLPYLNGLALLREIRELKPFHELPVIVMTSSNDPLDYDECERLGVVKYVTKPVSFDRFLQAIAIVLPERNKVTPTTFIE